MKKNPTLCAEGEHLIAYCYPTSEGACRHSRGKTGCYVVQVGSEAEEAVDSFAEAISKVSARGTGPQRWSMDHEMNLRFLQPEDLVLVTTVAASATPDI
jgi:hypothetical protein